MGIIILNFNIKSENSPIKTNELINLYQAGRINNHNFDYLGEMLSPAEQQTIKPVKYLSWNASLLLKSDNAKSEENIKRQLEDILTEMINLQGLNLNNIAYNDLIKTIESKLKGAIVLDMDDFFKVSECVGCINEKGEMISHNIVLDSKTLNESQETGQNQPQ